MERYAPLAREILEHRAGLSTLIVLWMAFVFKLFGFGVNF